MIVVYSAPATEPLTIAEVLRHCKIDASNQELAPAAPTVALASPAVAGNVDDGVHRYRVTFVTADGETEGGIISGAVTVSDKTVNGKVELTAIPLGGSLVTSRKVYRTAAGGSTYLLLTTIADNTTTAYTDNIADSSLGAAAPATNTTDDPKLTSLIKMAREKAEQELKRKLITQTLDAYFDEFPDCIELPPLSSVTAITYYDTDGAEQTLSADYYDVDIYSRPARITQAYGYTWPSTYDMTNAVKVRFVAGYGAASAVPNSVKQWMLMQIKQALDGPAPLQAGTFSEQPYNYIDGLLDSERVYR